MTKKYIYLELRIFFFEIDVNDFCFFLFKKQAALYIADLLPLDY